MNNILIVSSAAAIDGSLFDLFQDLGRERNNFFWLLDKGVLTPSSLPGERLANRYSGPRGSDFFSRLLFVGALPWLWLSYLLYLGKVKRQRGITQVVCVSDREKLIVSPLAKILGLKMIWLEMPGKPKTGSDWLKRRLARGAEIVVFTLAGGQGLADRGYPPERIHNISLGVNLRSAEQQDDLFSSLAKADKPHSFYKSFTIGVVTGQADRRRLELLLQAVKNCLNIIPNFRLVVIGQDTGSGNLNWLIKSLGLERRVWLVGEQMNLSEWFADLDIYVILAQNPGLADLERALIAASKGLPILGMKADNLSEIIIEGQTGTILESGGAESLAQAIIALEADERRRQVLGRNAADLAFHHFDRGAQLRRLQEIVSAPIN